MAPVEAIVEIIKEDYLIVSLPTMSHSIAFVAVKTFNSLESAFSRFKEGQKIKIVLTKASTATPPSPLPHPSKKSSKKSSSKHQPAGIPASFQGLLEQRNIGVLRQDAAPLAKQKSTAAGNNGSPFSSGTSSNNNRKSNTLKDPFDSTLTSLDDVTPGRLVKVRVKSIKSNQINVEIAANLMGRIHICEFVDCLEDLNDIKSPFKNIKNDDIIEAKVVGFHDVKTHDALAISRKSTVSSLTVDLTTRKSDLSAANGSLALSLEDSDACRHAQFEKLEQNDIVLGFIQTVMNDAVWIYLSPSLMGRAYILECSTSLSALQNIKEHFVAGQAVKCRVISKDQEKKSLDLSLLLADEDYGKIETGKLVVGRVSKVSPESGLLVQLPSRLMGRVHLTNISDTYVKDPTAGFVKGQLVQCYVVHSCIDEAKNQHQIDLSLRESRVGAVSTSTGGDDAELSSIASIEADMVVQGYVKNTSENGCFVALSPSLTARVKIADLSDSFIKDWKPQFPVGKLVKGKIMSVDQRTNRIEFSLKLSVIDPAAAAAAQDQASAGEDGGLKFEDLIQGLKVKGAITKVEKYGVFIKLHNSKVSGLCHISEISDEEITSIDKLFSSGDVVKAFVLAIDKKKKRVNFGLKASYFDDEDAMEVDDCSSEEEEEDRGDHESDSAQEENGSIPDQEDDEESMEEEDDVEVGSGMEVDELPIATSPSAVGSIKSTQDIRSIMSSATPLAIDSDDDAMADAVASDEESVDDAEEEEDKSAVSSGSEVDDDDDYNNNDVSTKKSRRAKKREKQEEEKRTVAKEQMIAAGDAPPETADDFERLLLGSPHSSFLWIQYMAFQIQLTEIEKARQVTERALKTISFKEEKERMNVWVAYMNLENSYGTRDSLIKVFDRAVSTNDPKAVYMQLAQVYRVCVCECDEYVT